jgi:hypothetical protein
MELGVLLHRASIAYSDPHYKELLKQLPPADVAAHRMQILWP